MVELTEEERGSFLTLEEIREARAMECLAELEGVAWAMSEVWGGELRNDVECN